MTRAQPGSLFSSFWLHAHYQHLMSLTLFVCVCVCVCVCVHLCVWCCMSACVWGGASICHETVKEGALQWHRLRKCIPASVLLLSLKAVREAVWAFGSLTPLENCVQIKILKPLIDAEGLGVCIQYVSMWNLDKCGESIFFLKGGDAWFKNAH